MASGNDASRDPKKVSVLFLSPQWQRHGNPMANITRSLIEDLHKVDPRGLGIEKACCLIEDGRNINQKDVESAAKFNVKLIGAELPRSKRSSNIKASIDWLDSNAATYYRQIAEESHYDFIIGHVPYLANGPLDIKDIWQKRGYPSCLVQVVHSLPKTNDGSVDEGQLKEWLSETDVILSIGEAMKLQVDHYIEFLDVGKPFNMVYIPGGPIELFKLKRMSPEEQIKGPQHITIITGGRKELATNGLDYDLGVSASAKATSKILEQCNVRQCVEMNLFTVGSHEEEKEAWKSHFTSALNDSCSKDKRLGFKYQTSSDNEKFKGILKRTALCILPLKPNSTVFGQEALMAAYAGVPVLVAKTAGFVEILSNAYAVGSMLDIKGTSSDVETWRDNITRKILNATDSGQEATAIQQYLKKDTSIAKSHRSFVTTLIGR